MMSNAPLFSPATKQEEDKEEEVHVELETN